MSCRRSLPFLGLAGLSFLVIAALRVTPAPSTAPPPVYPIQADSAATQVLNLAIAALAPERIQWIKATFWQQVNLDSPGYLVEGTYLGGPGQRLRLDLQTSVDASRRRLEIVSDGRTLWEAEQVDAEAWTTSKVDWQQVQQAWPADRTAAVYTGAYATHWFRGPAQLLENLRRQVIFTRHDAFLWRQRDVIMLTGARPGKADRPWPMYQPRQCRLVLDAGTSWPHRLEWWGPVPSVAGDVLLVQLELRDAVLQQPVPEQAFTFTGAKTGVIDRTAEWLVRGRR